MTKYVKFQLPLAFIKKCGEMPFFSGMAPINLSAYNSATINAVLQNPKVSPDLGRASLKFGSDSESMTFGSAETTEQPEIIFRRIYAAALKQNCELTLNEIRAIMAFYNSIGDATQIQQGGIFCVSEAIYSFIFNLVNQPVSEKNSLGLHVRRVHNDLIVSYQEEIFRFAKTTSMGWLGKKDPLFRTKSSFLFTHHKEQVDREDSYEIFPLEKTDDRLLADSIWDDMLVGALKNMEKMNKFSMMDLLHIPFMVDRKFSSVFCEKLAQDTQEMMNTAIEFIDACFINDMEMRNIIAAQLAMNDVRFKQIIKPQVKINPPVAVEKTSLIILNDVGTMTDIIKPVGIKTLLSDAFNSALERLNHLILDPDYDKNLRDYADTVITAVKNLSDKDCSRNLVLLTEVLERTALAIIAPQDSDNLKHFQALIKPVRNKNWGKLAAGITMMLIGAAFITVAILFSASTFGVPAMLGAGGVIAGGAALISSGIAIAVDTPLKQITVSTAPFWNKPKPVTVVQDPEFQEHKAPSSQKT
jgi:hypothetical protein